MNTQKHSSIAVVLSIMVLSVSIAILASSIQAALQVPAGALNVSATQIGTMAALLAAIGFSLVTLMLAVGTRFRPANSCRNSYAGWPTKQSEEPDPIIFQGAHVIKEGSYR